MKVRFTIGAEAPATERTLSSCFKMGGLLVDLSCELDEAKHAVWRNRPGEAAIALEGAWLRARDIELEFPEFAARARTIVATAKPMAKRLMDRKEPFSYDEQRETEMAVLLMQEDASALIGDGRDACGPRR